MKWFSALVSPLTFEEKAENELGRGGYGAVYTGKFKGKEVAVKVPLGDAIQPEQKREMEEHLLLNNENVLKLLHIENSRDKTCLVLELCAGTLTDYCEDKYKGPELPPDGIVLYQIANGLRYIHSQKLVHGDVKPDNILISKTSPIQMKLSDFGYVKKISTRGMFEQNGTLNWRAPEILQLLHIMDDTIIELPHGTIQSDTFAAGCVFFFFLTRGKHPFGISVEMFPGNILNDNPTELNEHNQNLKQGDDRFLYELIRKMIKPKEDRIALPEVIKQLTTILNASRQVFKRVDRLVCEGELGKCVARFHPKKSVIACGVIENKIIFFSAENNSSNSFFNWNEDENKIQTGHQEEITTMEWNEDGTQLAAIFNKNVIVCWSYPNGEILFQNKLNKWMDRIEWNPFRRNLFATFYPKSLGFGKFILLFNSCPVKQRPFHFYTIECEKAITSVQWISENRVALGLSECEGIRIWEIDESKNFAKIVERLCMPDTITDLAWDERTKCLAACSTSGWMTILSMDSDQPIHSTKVDGFCYSLAWRPNMKQTDDNFILVGGLNEGKIVIWTPLAKEKTRILCQHSICVDSLSFSPDGRFLASADHHGKLIIWATESWEPVYVGEEKRSVGPFSWSSSSSTNVPDYKLTLNTYDGEVGVIESADGQWEIPSKD